MLNYNLDVHLFNFVFGVLVKQRGWDTFLFPLLLSCRVLDPKTYKFELLKMLKNIVSRQFGLWQTKFNEITKKLYYNSDISEIKGVLQIYLIL